jgi:hypothetical protein
MLNDGILGVSDQGEGVVIRKISGLSVLAKARKIGDFLLKYRDLHLVGSTPDCQKPSQPRFLNVL